MLKMKRLTTEKSTLANGATLLFTPIETAPRLAFSMFLPGGNLLDPVPGMSDVVDRLLMKGTHSRTQEQISVEIDGLTLEVDTDTKRDYSAIQATMLEEDLDVSFDLIGDLFSNASFVEFEREKQKMAGEIAMDMDSPKSRASDQFMRTMFEDVPYGTVGSVLLENLPKMASVEDARKHYQAAFHPGNLIVSVAGNIAPEKIARVIEHAFPARQTPPPAVADTLEARLKALNIGAPNTVTFARDDSSQAHIYKGWLAPDAQDDDYPALALMNTILGAAGLSSRLFLELRDKQGLAYNVRSSFESFRYKGIFYLYIGTEPKNKDKCLKGFIEECDKLMQTPVGTDELADAKRNILGRRSVFLETAHQQANYIGSNYALGRSLEEIDSIADRIDAVTADDIQRVARKYLSQPAITSVVGPSQIL